MKLFITVAAVALLVCAAGTVQAQGIDDLFAGRLVNPAVGQWAWYDLTDAAGGNKHLIRQAVVGQEKVNGQTGYWVEFELIPPLGFKTVYQMLVTGPANERKNVHKIRLKRGPGPVEDVPVSSVFEKDEPKVAPPRKPRGTDEIPLAQGSVKADHYAVQAPKGTLDVWVNEEVPPTGIVRVKSPDGEMVLRSYGIGGKGGESAMGEATPTTEPKVSVKVEKVRTETPKKGKGK